MTETVDPTLTAVLDVIEDLAWKKVVELALARLFIAAPFLAWGPIGWVVGLAATYFAGHVYEALREYTDFRAIERIKAGQREDLDRAEVSLKQLAQTKGIDSPEFKKARLDAKAALRKFGSVIGK